MTLYFQFSQRSLLARLATSNSTFEGSLLIQVASYNTTRVMGEAPSKLEFKANLVEVGRSFNNNEAFQAFFEK